MESNNETAAISDEELAGIVESAVTDEPLTTGEEVTENIVVDTSMSEYQLEQIHNDLVGVKSILQLLITFVIAYFVWTVLRTVYKFFDSMF